MSSVWSAFNCRSASDFGVPSPRPAITRRRLAWPVRLASTRCFMSKRGEITEVGPRRLCMQGPYVLCQPPSIPACGQTITVPPDAWVDPWREKSPPGVAGGWGVSSSMCGWGNRPAPMAEKEPVFPPQPGVLLGGHGRMVPIAFCFVRRQCGRARVMARVRPPRPQAGRARNQCLMRNVGLTPCPPKPLKIAATFKAAISGGVRYPYFCPRAVPVTCSRAWLEHIVHFQGRVCTLSRPKLRLAKFHSYARLANFACGC